MDAQPMKASEPAKAFEEMSRAELIRLATYWRSEYERAVRDHSDYLDRERKERELIEQMTTGDWLAAARYYVREKL